MREALMRVRSSLTARTAAAAGLFSSCVSPAVIVPSAVSRCRLSMISRAARPPYVMPSSRWKAIGNHSVTM
jgi:hypothetical protein